MNSLDKCNCTLHYIPGGAAIVGAIGAGTPRPAARPIPAPGAALAPSNLDLDYKKQNQAIITDDTDSLTFLDKLSK